MPPIISARELSKRYGSAPLFEKISFTVSERERIGVIGPNGSGKSTLLRMLTGAERPDSGVVAVRKGMRMATLKQVSEFAPQASVRSVIEAAMARAGVPEQERLSRFAETLGRAGFTDFEAPAETLSGGWKKRLGIAEVLAENPDILLLDEPTNHLDLAGIEWLESVLQGASMACVVVSHDRYFLENVASGIVEINRAYPEGALRVEGNYGTFLEKKEEYLHAQKKRHQSLENRVHTELEWLRRGPKARTTKAKARITKAHELMSELAGMNHRARSASAEIEFGSNHRKTKQLITLESVSSSLGGRRLFGELKFSITAGMRVGLVGPNGSGKTTLLRLIKGELPATTGKIKRADRIRITYFDQNRELDPDLTLRRALAPDSDAVVYQGRVIHVAAWAERFLFEAETLNQRVGRLSGGERARVLIAQLMLQPADVLLLDEPTNDLDIPTLEILEESLLEYEGALVLVTHDRFLLDRVSNLVLGLDGAGAVERFADYRQWETWLRGRNTKPAPGKEQAVADKAAGALQPQSPGTKKKFSYSEKREFEGMESRIHEAEADLVRKKAALEEPELTKDRVRLLAACKELDEAQTRVERLYSRWAELEQKQS